MTAPPATEPRGGLPRWIEGPLAAGGLLLSLPLLAVLAMLIRATSPGPALFRQQRVGRGGRLFTLYKLRSMRVAEGSRVTRSGDRRVTAIGRLLRATKLDELPELWNVVRGDVSLVGPRPEVPAFVELGDPRWQRVLRARPGLTDPVTLCLRGEEALLAEIRRRHPELATEDLYRRYLQPWKLEGYIDYLERRSLLSDLGVLISTLRVVLDPARARPPTFEQLREAAEAARKEVPHA